ncbi:MAG: DUF4214 domain-containing protein [Acidimicrobiales bacterium]
MAIAAIAAALALLVPTGVAAGRASDLPTLASTPGPLAYLRATSTPATGSVAPRLPESTRISTARSTFVVTYHGFPTAAKASFQRAVDLWSLLVTSSVPIRIDATWTALDPGVLGGAGPTDLIRDFPGAPRSGTWYPVALANARAGRDLSSSSDITAVFSSVRSDWYFGTDGEVPANRLDLTTVVLHEIGHGLGMVDSLQYVGGVASWGSGTPYPFAYDRLAASAAGTPLSSYPSGSSGLASAIRSNALRWAGGQGSAANGGVGPRLYAPASFEPGSSVSHLDEGVFPTGDPDALMTPYLDDGEALHDPGDIVLGMLRDLGWSTTGPKGVPAAPALATALAGDQRVILGWTPPVDTGRQPLTGYRVYRYPGDAASPDQHVDLPATATSTSVVGLANGTPYRFAVAAVNASGPSAASARSASIRPVDLAPFSRSDTFVRQQFRDVAGREPTLAELLVWLDDLHSGRVSPAGTIAGIAEEAGVPNVRVARLYSAYFERLPDVGGYGYWVRRLRAGTSLKRASDTFAASSEFQRRYGSLSDRGFVARVYENVLGRQPDPSGLAYWVRKLETRALSRGSVMLNFSESSENVRKRDSEVHSVLLRSSMLQRMPTPVEHADDVALLDGPAGPSDLAEVLRRLPEYDARIP